MGTTEKLKLLIICGHGSRSIPVVGDDIEMANSLIYMRYERHDMLKLRKDIAMEIFLLYVAMEDTIFILDSLLRIQLA